MISKKATSLIVFLFSVLVIHGSAQSAGVDTKSLPPIVNFILQGENDQTPPISSGTFLEQDGLVVVELESASAPSGWQQKTGDGALGSYIEWEGQNNFNSPGQGIISINVAIANPGTYRFIWRSSIREGTNTTESNDSWLRVIASNFYGYRGSDNSTVCPRDQLSTNRCIGRAPAGSSSDGWLKNYRSGGPAADWLWRSFTSDSDAHLIYADFDSAGEYEIQISGRSKHHAVDRFVLFRSRNTSDDVAEIFATSSDRAESATAP